MAFPVIAATNKNTSASSVTTHTINLPSGINENDLIIVMIAQEGGNTDSFGTWSNSFIEIADTNNDDVVVAIAYKFAASSEVSSITVVSSNAERSSQCSMRITGMAAAVAPHISVESNSDGGTNDSPDPPSFSPSPGQKEYMWIAFEGHERDNVTTGFPTNYDSNQVTQSMASGGTVSFATDEVDAATENPGVFTLSTGDRWKAFTLAIEPVSSGTEFTQTVTGGLTPTGAGVYQTLKALAGAVTPTGALGPFTTLKGVAGAVTPTGALNKDTSVSVAGAVTPTGAAIKQAQISMAGDVTPTGAIVLQTQKTVAGSVTPVGAIGPKDIFKVVSGVVTPTGVPTKLTSISVDGAVTPTGALAAISLFKQTVTGAATPAGTLVKSTRKVVAGSVVPTSAMVLLTKISLAGVVTPTGVIIRQTRKGLAGAVTPTGALAALTLFSQTVTGAATPTGALVKSTLKPLAGAVTPVGTQTKLTTTSLSGAVTPTGATGVVLHIKQTVLGVVSSIVGALATLFIDGGAPSSILGKGRLGFIRLFKGLS